MATKHGSGPGRGAAAALARGKYTAYSIPPHVLGLGRGTLTPLTPYFLLALWPSPSYLLLVHKIVIVPPDVFFFFFLGLKGVLVTLFTLIIILISLEATTGVRAQFVLRMFPASWP